MKKPFGTLLGDSVPETSPFADSVALKINGSHGRWVRSLLPGHARTIRLLLLTDAFFPPPAFPRVIFFFSVECLQASVGRHLNITKPEFLDFSAAILCALQHCFNSSCLFALLFSGDESLLLAELTGELREDFLLFLKRSWSLLFRGVLWPVSYSVQLKLISCPSSSQCLQFQKLLSPV